MRNGTGTSFAHVPTLADNGLITKTYLRDMESAVKQRTPTAGDNIIIKVTDGSYVISSTSSVGVVAGGGGTPTEFKEFTLTVCSNGTPGTIIVYGKAN